MPTTSDQVVPFVAGDGYHDHLVHVVGKAPPTRGPVLLVHGAGVRGNIFRAPVAGNLVDVLVEDGFDVWLENWRASIDNRPNQWTLDKAAVFDHPAAVRTVLERTGAGDVKAVIHCQGSTSFMMAAAAGLLPQVSTIVTNAVSLHPVVPTVARWKGELFHRPMRALTRYIDPQWGIESPDVIASAVVGWVRLAHHECKNMVCKMASFTYGVGHPTLWSHMQIDDATHEWLKGEFGFVPLTFFDQMVRCIRAGHLVPTDGLVELPSAFGVSAPRTDADVVLLAGEHNRCFLPESQQRTFDYFEQKGGGRYEMHVLPGYGHLDVFMGKDAARDVFPIIRSALRAR
jgi:pimeloyl-ACP methyl ester carboxylesterase